MSTNDIPDTLAALVARIENDTLSSVVQINIVKACALMGGRDAEDLLYRIASAMKVNDTARLRAAEELAKIAPDRAGGFLRIFMADRDNPNLQRAAFDVVKSTLSDRELVVMVEDKNDDVLRQQARDVLAEREPDTPLVARAILRSWLDEPDIAARTRMRELVAANGGREKLGRAAATLAAAIPTDTARDDWTLLARIRRKAGITVPAVMSFKSAVNLSTANDDLGKRRDANRGMIQTAVLAAVIGLVVTFVLSGLLGVLEAEDKEMLTFFAPSFITAALMAGFALNFFAPVTASPNRIAAFCASLLGSIKFTALFAFAISGWLYYSGDWRDALASMMFVKLVGLLWIALASIRPLMSMAYGLFRSQSLRDLLPWLIGTGTAAGILALNIVLTSGSESRVIEVAAFLFAMPSLVALGYVVRHIDMSKRDKLPTDQRSLRAVTVGGMSVVGLFGLGLMVPAFLGTAGAGQALLAGDTRFLASPEPATRLVAEDNAVVAFETSLEQELKIDVEGGDGSLPIRVSSTDARGAIDLTVSSNDPIKLPAGAYIACLGPTNCAPPSSPKWQSVLDLIDQRIGSALPEIFSHDTPASDRHVPSNFVRLVFSGDVEPEAEQKLTDYLALEALAGTALPTTVPAGEGGREETRQFLLAPAAAALTLAGSTEEGSVTLSRGTLLIRPMSDRADVYVVQGRALSDDIDPIPPMLTLDNVENFDSFRVLSESNVTGESLQTLSDFAALSLRPASEIEVSNPTLATALALDQRDDLRRLTLALLGKQPERAETSKEEIKGRGGPKTYLALGDPTFAGIFTGSTRNALRLKSGWVNEPHPDLCRNASDALLIPSAADASELSAALEAQPIGFGEKETFLAPFEVPPIEFCDPKFSGLQTREIPFNTPFVFEDYPALNVEAMADVDIAVHRYSDFGWQDDSGGGSEVFALEAGHTVVCIGYFGDIPEECGDQATAKPFDSFPLLKNEHGGEIGEGQENTLAPFSLGGPADSSRVVSVTIDVPVANYPAVVPFEEWLSAAVGNGAQDSGYSISLGESDHHRGGLFLSDISGEIPILRLPLKSDDRELSQNRKQGSSVHFPYKNTNYAKLSTRPSTEDIEKLIAYSGTIRGIGKAELPQNFRRQTTLARLVPFMPFDDFQAIVTNRSGPPIWLQFDEQNTLSALYTKTVDGEQIVPIMASSTFKGGCRRIPDAETSLLEIFPDDRLQALKDALQEHGKAAGIDFSEKRTECAVLNLENWASIEQHTGSYLTYYDRPENGIRPEWFDDFFVVTDADTEPHADDLPSGTIVRIKRPFIEDEPYVDDDSPEYDVVLGYSYCSDTCYVNRGSLTLLSDTWSDDFDAIPEMASKGWIKVDERSLVTARSSDWVDRRDEFVSEPSSLKPVEKFKLPE